MVQVSERVSSIAPSMTLAISAKANEMKANGEKVISFGVGEPDFNTPDAIKTAAKQAIDDNWSRYSPVPGYPCCKYRWCGHGRGSHRWLPKPLRHTFHSRRN